MALFEQFPYTNFHEMNLDWALQVAESAKEHLDGYDEDMATIAQNMLDTESWKNAAAGSATAAAASALAAAGSVTSAANEVLEAEAWAKGTKNGAAVPASAPQYQNNAKYWANDKTNVYEAEAWAKGTKNGTPVTSDEPQYENNAKYYAEEMATSLPKYIPFSMGICFGVIVEGLSVLASRTVTQPNGAASLLNVPGFAVFPEPLHYTGEPEFYNTELLRGRKDVWRFICGYELNNPARILLPYYINAKVTIDGIVRDLIGVRVFNLNTGAWEIDGSVGNVICFFTNTHYEADDIEADNNAAIGEQIV